MQRNEEEIGNEREIGKRDGKTKNKIKKNRKKKQNGREGISLGTDVPSTISEMIHVQGSSINDVMQIWTIFDLTAPNITSLASVAIKSLNPSP